MYAERSTSTWASGFGAGRPLERPSELTAEPATTARTVSPSRRASAMRLSTNSPPPSARIMPSASAENALMWPSLACAPMLSKPSVAAGVMIMLTPPASATSDSPERRLRTA
ncbi:Uncharacterised protein [Mycobacteroides abscessus subsp. abscessus]|nr:Uncharacterised protein [Mycobacteroides abscessus subsp. abscessus]